MEKEKYVIFKKDDGSPRYIYCINRNSVNTSGDIGDAIEFENSETAKSAMEHIKKDYPDTAFGIFCIKTTMEEIL